MRSRSLIAVTGGAVRASAIVTITTQAPHGLVPLDVVFIQSVTDVSFNGTYQVVSVPTSTTFTYLQVGSPDATSGTGYLDQIAQGDVYTDTVLMPMMNAAYRNVQRKLLEDGSPTATITYEWFGVDPDTKSITDVTDPQLPADFLAPRMMWERMQSGPRYRPLQEVDEIPDRPEQSLNLIYSWRTEGIYLPGATQPLDMKLRYYRALYDLAAPDSYILIRGGSDAVAYYTASLAANSRSDPRAGQFESKGDEAMEQLLDMQAHSGQYMPRRRKPYGGRRCGYARGLYGW